MTARARYDATAPVPAGAAVPPSGAVATAVLVTHNSARHIAAALAPLLRAGLAVRVVDNASRDGTVALLAREFPAVEVIANARNVGFAAAVNQAIAGCDSDVVLLVNPDCVLPVGTAWTLLGYLDSHPTVGIVGPRLLDHQGRVAISAHPFEDLTSVLLSRFGGSLVPVRLRRLVSGARRRSAYDACRQPSGPASVDWLSGACLAIRRALLTELGGLDESYFMYYEDEELCLQARRRGVEVVLLPTVSATHTGGGSSADPNWIWPHLYRSMLHFFARHRRSTYQAVRFAVLLRALLGIGLAAVRLAVSPRSGAARARAWFSVARIAATTTPSAAERQPACTS
ncbi:glycosyltransferase family 2 protein [Plantactinospora sp. ZYX-F-223]|uniref:glycosyltransferase family 2 protein n=1 Tax=Plantactinospora sp. ZYX-F-223 TaxID=3144103 RepID=UPI0031FCF175